jgi:hypothetical protein
MIGLRSGWMGVLLLTMVAPLLAQQEPISADRPGFADGPDVVGTGTAQLELGLTLDDEDGSVITVPTLVRIGLTSNLELRLESDVVAIDDGSRDLAPFAAGVKWSFRQGEVPLSLLASVQPPSGEDAAATSDFEGEVRVVSDLDLGRGFSFTPNVGISLAESQSVEGVVAASLGYESGNMLPFADFEFRTSDGDTSAIVDAGVAWILGTEMQLDVSGGVRVQGDGYSDWFIGAGVSRRFRW